MLPVPLVGEEEHQIAKVPRSMVVNIIRPRLEETFEMVKERLDSSGLTRAAGTRVVLTGGACQLAGARETGGAHPEQAGASRPSDRVARPAGLGIRSGVRHRGRVCSRGPPARAARCTTSTWMPNGRPGFIRRIVNFLKERV